MADCRTCKHNSYGDSPNLKDWVDCTHPITLAKTPKPEAGDPAWVNAMTSDMTVSDMACLISDCPAWEPRP
jgi:hypothetical protein